MYPCSSCWIANLASGGETIKATSRPRPAVWWRNTADENENNPGISYPSSYGPLGGRHSVLGVAREPAARCPVRFGWRTPSCSAAHCSACAPGFSINFDDANEPSHGAARSGFPSAPSSPAVITQPNQPAASPATSPAPPTSPANAEQGQPPVLSPTTPAARRITLPPENQMSEADRRQIQKMLQGMKHYQGPINGKFGPLTRAAIRRYQDSIGAKSTGYLTAEEATRLASTR